MIVSLTLGTINCMGMKIQHFNESLILIQGVGFHITYSTLQDCHRWSFWYGQWGCIFSWGWAPSWGRNRCHPLCLYPQVYLLQADPRGFQPEPEKGLFLLDLPQSRRLWVVCWSAQFCGDPNEGQGLKVRHYCVQCKKNFQMKITRGLGTTKD